MAQAQQTLLYAIEEVEKEAAALVTREKERIEQEREKIKKDAQAARKNIQDKAAQTSESIYKERMQRAHQDAQQIVQASKNIASDVSKIAEKNRARTLESARVLFAREYEVDLDSNV